jgi:type III secretory pathway component EscU
MERERDWKYKIKNIFQKYYIYKMSKSAIICQMVFVIILAFIFAKYFKELSDFQILGLNVFFITLFSFVYWIIESMFLCLFEKIKKFKK